MYSANAVYCTQHQLLEHVQNTGGATGGTHGGQGAPGYSNPLQLFTPATAYGSTAAPATWGSGGGASFTYVSGQQYSIVM
jgi:hypothetical protein